MTRLHLAPLVLLAAVNTSAQSTQESVYGVHESSAGAEPVVIELMAGAAGIEGSLQWQDKLYLIECAAGDDDDEEDADEALEQENTGAEAAEICSGAAYELDEGALTYVEIVGGDIPQLLLYVNGDLETPVSIALAGAEAVAAEEDADLATGLDATADAAEESDTDLAVSTVATDLDPALVGRWVNSGSHSSGAIGAAWESFMLLGADGVMQVSEARMAGGGSLGSFSGGGEEVLTAQWKADGQYLYFAAVGASDAQWHLLGTYVLREPSLLVQHVDGTRLLYRRTH